MRQLRQSVDMQTSGVLNMIITDAWIQTEAGDLYYDRGLDYFEEGRVSALQQSSQSIRARVTGTEDYAVVLTLKAETVIYQCDCPVGSEGDFCKHCVATALAWLHQQETAEEESPKITPEDVTKALQQEDKETLIRWLLAWAEEYPGLQERLVMAAARRMGSTVLIAQTRKSLEKALRIQRFVEYRDMPTYAAGVEDAINGIEGLLECGEATAVVEMCERGLNGLADAVEDTDDSDGYINGLTEQLQELHLQACQTARPDPEALGEKLFLLEWKAAYGEWHGAAEKYQHVLGTKGLEAFRKRAEMEWTRAPELTEEPSYRDENRSRLTSIMESLAEQSGDLEQLVAVLASELGSAHKYLRIATLYHQAGKHEEALDWAQKGAARYSGFDGKGLRLFVAEEHQRRGYHGDAMRLVWIEFRDSPGLENYQLLERIARAAEDWADWRAQALAYIRRGLGDAAEKRRTQRTASMGEAWWKQDASLLVEILLYEKKHEEAWQAAQAGGCSNDYWLELARVRENEYPEEAAALYLRLGEHAIVHARGNRYEGGVELLEKAAALLHGAGKSEEFEQRFEVIRGKYKAKRNLMKLTGQRHKFLYLRRNS
jgi:uncharacterized Zn finger protein